MILLSLVCLSAPVSAQINVDSIEGFDPHIHHLQEVTVTGLTGTTRANHSPAPISVIPPRVLQETSSASPVLPRLRRAAVFQSLLFADWAIIAL